MAFRVWQDSHVERGSDWQNVSPTGWLRFSIAFQNSF